MRVIAIRDSYFNDGTKPTDLAIHKGSIYNVIGKRFFSSPHHFKDTGNYYPNGVYAYELLEQTGMHIEDMFLELHDDDLVEEQIESLKQLS